MLRFELNYTSNIEQSSFHHDIELIYLLHGSGKIAVSGKMYHMSAYDYILVNSREDHMGYEDGDGLIGLFFIDYSQLLSSLKKERAVFHCSSMFGDIPVEIRQEFQGLLSRVARLSSEPEKHSVFEQRTVQYQMLDYLVSHFLLPDDSPPITDHSHSQKHLKADIQAFIHNNFEQSLSVKDISDYFYLSPSYFSRYFKQQFGVSCKAYLSSVRCKQAADRLLDSSKSISVIALEGGFPNAASFNKTFFDQYGVTPAQYRRQWLLSHQDAPASIPANVFAAVSAHEASFIPGRSHTPGTERREIAVSDKNHSTKLVKTWDSMINVGTVPDLRLATVQKQVLMLRDELHFSSVRIWGLFQKSMQWCLEQDAARPFFGNLDTALDFLVGNHLLPWIDFSSKHTEAIAVQIPKARGLDAKRITAQSDDMDPIALQRQVWLIEQMLLHVVDRYGRKAVQRWTFELSRPEAGGDDRSPVSSVSRFISLYSSVSAVIDRCVPGASFGGGGLSLAGDGDSQALIDKLSLLPRVPDFLSIRYFPQASLGLELPGAGSLPQCIDACKEKMRRASLNCHIHVTEWNMTSVDSDRTNDSCLRAAYTVKELIGSAQSDAGISYWIGIDYGQYSRAIPSGQVGSSGLLSEYCIRKPVWFAFEFMNALGNDLLYTDDRCIVTRSGENEYRIVCHSYTGAASGNTESELALRNPSNQGGDRPLTLDFSLPASPASAFRVETFFINMLYGSVYDEWNRLLRPQPLSQWETRYLKNVCTPHIDVTHCLPTNRSIVFQASLQPNEIQFILVQEASDKP